AVRVVRAAPLVHGAALGRVVAAVDAVEHAVAVEVHRGPPVAGRLGMDGRGRRRRLRVCGCGGQRDRKEQEWWKGEPAGRRHGNLLSRKGDLATLVVQTGPGQAGGAVSISAWASPRTSY